MAVRLPVARSVEALRRTVQGWRLKGQSIALVPTMGSLHEGHLALVQLARKSASRVVVSIFVNPTQFGPNEDFGAYPRDEASDWEKLSIAKADLLYAPPLSEIYADDFATRVEVAGVSQGLCGASRPHHFAGVATVVTKLFMQCLPDSAVFGEKDYQQLLVIRQLVKDLNLPISVIGAPIMRDKDGLALSSRNAYLSEQHRLMTAPQLNLTLKDMAADLASGRDLASTIANGRERLEQAGFKLDYLEVRRADNLTPFDDEIDAPARVLAAVYLGKTRLIDNMPVPVNER
ncbi:MAG: pantoate--beta-alanine ligase [Hyphomicrobiales bacterium]|nr:pantoate--beta-alanine ligase [Hyphomicrobiales bacterium]